MGPVAAGVGRTLITLVAALFAYLSPTLIASPFNFITCAQVSSSEANLLDPYWNLLEVRVSAPGSEIIGLPATYPGASPATHV
jgi:hypothetical protein